MSETGSLEESTERAELKLRSATPTVPSLEARPHPKETPALRRPTRGWTKNRAKALFDALRRADFECASPFIDEKTARVVNAEGQTPLHLAAAGGWSEGVKDLTLLSNARATDNKGRTALMEACEIGCIESVRALLPASDATAKDAYGRTALMWAAFRGRTECALAVLPVSDPLALDFYGRSAILLAARSRTAGCVEALATHGAMSAMSARDANRRTPLILAAQFSAGAVQALLPRSDLAATDCHGWTALHHAAQFGRADCIRCLLLAGADANAPDRLGFSSLMIAAQLGELESVMALLPLSNPCATNKAGATAFELAVEEGHAECADALSASASPAAAAEALAEFGAGRMPQYAAVLEAEALRIAVATPNPGRPLASKADFGAAQERDSPQGRIDSFECAKRCSADSITGDQARVATRLSVCRL